MPRPRPTVDGAALLAKVENHLGTDPAHDQLRALVVLVGDRTVVENYYDGSTADSVWDVESVTKSIVSTLVGIAIAEGKISGVDATLAELLPDSAAGMSRAAARTTLRQVLSMSGGFPEDDFTKPRRWQAVRDPVRLILRAHDPGLVGFTYSNQGAHLIAAILTEATGVRCSHTPAPICSTRWASSPVPRSRVSLATRISRPGLVRGLPGLSIGLGSISGGGWSNSGHSTCSSWASCTPTRADGTASS